MRAVICCLTCHISPTKLVIPDKAEKVGWDAFLGCSALEEVTIGRSVKTLAGGTFHGCDNIWEVWSFIEEPFDVTDYEDIHGDVVFLGKCFPDAVTSRAILHVPDGTTEKYRSKRGWRDFGIIAEMNVDAVDSLSVGQDNNSPYYDLNGRRITSRTRQGIYIREGHKQVVK